jgi:hypothetical protein
MLNVNGNDVGVTKMCQVATILVGLDDITLEDTRDTDGSRVNYFNMVRAAMGYVGKLVALSCHSNIFSFSKHRKLKEHETKQLRSEFGEFSVFRISFYLLLINYSFPRVVVGEDDIPDQVESNDSGPALEPILDVSSSRGVRQAGLAAVAAIQRIREEDEMDDESDEDGMDITGHDEPDHADVPALEPAAPIHTVVLNGMDISDDEESDDSGDSALETNLGESSTQATPTPLVNQPVASQEVTTTTSVQPHGSVSGHVSSQEQANLAPQASNQVPNQSLAYCTIPTTAENSKRCYSASRRYHNNDSGRYGRP